MIIPSNTVYGCDFAKCDYKGAENLLVHVSVDIGSRVDASGNNDREYFDADLCPVHAARVISAFFDEAQDKYRRSLAGRIEAVIGRKAGVR